MVSGVSVNFNTVICKVKRGETPFYRFLGRVLRGFLRPRAPRIPGFLKIPLRGFYELHFLVKASARALVTMLYRHPLFQSRCEAIGSNVQIDALPYVYGHVEIHIGNEVYLGGRLAIMSGRMIDRPRLVIQDRAQVGWNVSIVVSREVVIEEDVIISYDCRISDGDGHPREADLRARHAPPDLDDIRPVRIRRFAWVGNGTHVMKGVTIGEGAVIGANSVVVSDIPPYCLAMGNPAEVYFRNYGRPSRDAGAVASGS
jgi:acetyltransferase-like isoleucine patch superfamily enzyme